MSRRMLKFCKKLQKFFRTSWETFRVSPYIVWLFRTHPHMYTLFAFCRRTSAKSESHRKGIKETRFSAPTGHTNLCWRSQQKESAHKLSPNQKSNNPWADEHRKEFTNLKNRTPVCAVIAKDYVMRTRYCELTTRTCVLRYLLYRQRTIRWNKQLSSCNVEIMTYDCRAIRRTICKPLCNFGINNHENWMNNLRRTTPQAP